MLGDAMSSGVAMRELRSTTVAARESAAPREGDHTSLGRLLRLIADPRSDESHVEAAIAHRRSDAQDAPSAPASPRVLALSDHRHISNIGTVLSAIDRALEALDNADTRPASDVTAARNLLRALATALANQSVSECVSTKHNVCVWTTQSKKRLELLQWMLLHRSPMAFGVVVNDALRDALGGDKSSQLTACLVVFELAQRRRRRLGRTTAGRWAVLLDPLVAVVQNGSVATAMGPKPSKLALAALDALIAVLCLATDSLEHTQQVLEYMAFVLSALVQWNARSVRRQWLLMAARQLASLVAMCGRDGTTDLFDMVAWHWNATAMWLCSRSDCVLSVKKTLVDDVTRTVDQVYRTSRTNQGDVGFEGAPQHKIAATLRRLCALFSLHSSSSAVLPTVAMKGKLLVALSSCLGAPAVRVLVLDMLRRLLIAESDVDKGSTVPVLSLSRLEVEAFISMVERLITKTGHLDNDVASLIAELSLRAGLTVHEDHSSAEPTTARVWLTIISRALDLYTTIPTFDDAMRTQWLRDTTTAVLNVLHRHSNKKVRTHAAALIPKLDQVRCLQYIVSTLLLEVDSATSGCLVAWIFRCAEGNSSLMADLSNVLVDSLCRGTMQPHSVLTPSDLGSASPPEVTHGEDFQAAVLAKSREGWCTRVTGAAQTTVLAVLIDKVFGSPRDSAFVTRLRELSLLGWFDDALLSILPIVTTHMQKLERLTEELLEDESTHASRVVEHLLFARLAPNLVLRVIPRTSFLSLHAAYPSKLLQTKTSPEGQHPVTRCLADLTQALWNQVLDPLEYKEVKMLSIELLTKLPVEQILPHVLGTLTGFLAGQGTPVAMVKLLAADDGLRAANCGFVAAKLLVYYLNLIFTDESTVIHDVDMLDKTLSVLLTVLSLPCSPNEAFSAEKSPLVDLQMGTIECISLLVTKSLKHTAKSQNDAELRLVEEAIVDVILAGFSNGSQHQNAPFVEDAQLQDRSLHMFQNWKAIANNASVERDRFSGTQVRICCCNILLSVLAKADTHGVSIFQNRILRARVLPSMQLELPSPVLAGCLQIAFSFFFKTGAALEQDDKPTAEIAHASIVFVVQILQSSKEMDDSVYMGTLKLLGALIGKVAWLWPSLAVDTTTQHGIAAGLQRLRDASPSASPPVRQLAQSLLQAILSE